MVTDKIRAIADELVGTCGGLGEELTTEEASQLDELIFCCDVCSWWHDTGDISENCPADSLICEKCGENLDELDA